MDTGSQPLLSLIVGFPKELFGLTMKVEDRLDAIESELAEIKATMLSSRDLKVVKLKGLWRGLKVDDKDVEAAKRSLFKHATD